jgi:hypothetical protein
MSSDCLAPCDPNKNPVLYPVAFSVFGAADGRRYGHGESVLLIGRFATNVCSLPQPAEAGPDCIPLMTVGMNLPNGSTCLSIPAAPSSHKVEADYRIRFRWDSSLDSREGVNFWVFPLDVRAGMYTARLSILGLSIPPACNIPGRATFSPNDLIPKGSRLLSPAVAVDSLPPAVVSVFAGSVAGSYSFPGVINIVVVFSKPVAFAELPKRAEQALSLSLSLSHSEAGRAGSLSSPAPFFSILSVSIW